LAHPRDSGIYASDLYMAIEMKAFVIARVKMEVDLERKKINRNPRG